MPSTTALRRPPAGELAVVALGGMVGSVARWLLEGVLPAGPGLPWGTLVVNVLGSAALAWLVVLAGRRDLPGWVAPGLGTGLLGGFTTFSTYAVQVATLGEPLLSLVLLVLTPVLCVGAAVAVLAVGRREVG